MDILIVFFIVMLAVAIACVLFAMQLSKRTFQCKACAKEFRVNWKKLVFVLHYDDCYEISCPHCHHKGCHAQTTEPGTDSAQ